MATVTYVGKQIKRAKVVDLAVGSATAAQTFITTVGGVKAVTYIAGTGETTTTVAAATLALLQAEPSGEFRALAFEAHPTDATKIRVTGPDDGYPFTITAGGTGTYTATTATAPLSPFDVADVLNYSGGALPSAADTLIVENTDADLRYNLAALTAIAVTFIRRASHTGRIGLPALNEVGDYPEYLPTFLEVDATSITVETNDTDRGQQVRIKSTAAGAETVRVAGTSTAALGDEPVELHALHAASTVWVSNSGLALCPLAGQTATIDTINAEESAIRARSGLTLTGAVLQACSSAIDCGFTTLKVQDGSCDVGPNGGATGIEVYAATLKYRSATNLGSPIVAAGGTLDCSEAPKALTGGTLTLLAGSTFLDPQFRVAWTGIVLSRCKLGDVSIDQGPNRTLVVS